MLPSPDDRNSLLRLTRGPRGVLLLVATVALGAVVGVGGCTEKELFPPGPPTTLAAGSSTTGSTAVSVTGGTDTTGTSSGTAASEPVRLKDVDPALLTGNFTQCPDCHSLLDEPGATSPALVASFSHGLHLGKGTTCEQCHAQPTHTSDGIRLPPMSKCFICHSQEDPNAPPGECSACHPADFPLKPSTHGDPTWLPVSDQRESVQGKHSVEGTQSPEECVICHEVPAFCNGCHKTPMPHADGWQELHKSEAKKSGASGCGLCHPKSEACQTCHHSGYKPGGPSWTELHPSVANAEGKDKCIKCHSVNTCAHCHVTGEYKAYD